MRPNIVLSDGKGPYRKYWLFSGLFDLRFLTEKDKPAIFICYKIEAFSPTKISADLVEYTLKFLCFLQRIQASELFTMRVERSPTFARGGSSATVFPADLLPSFVLAGRGIFLRCRKRLKLAVCDARRPNQRPAANRGGPPLPASRLSWMPLVKRGRQLVRDR